MTFLTRYVNYDIANTSVAEDLGQVGIQCPIPETFTQSKPWRIGFDHVGKRYINPAYVTATPDEMEESTDPEALSNFAPRPAKVWRLKEELARRECLKSEWTCGGGEARDTTMEDGTVKKWPEGSRMLQVKYDKDVMVPRYKRPEGSL